MVRPRASQPFGGAYRGVVAATPPDDPDSWTEEEWLAWLEEVDAESAPLPDGHPARPVRSTGIQLMGAAMLGMHRAIYGSEDPQIVMVVDADGDPPDPEELEVDLDPDDPDASRVTVRPWLHVDAVDAPDGDGPGGPGGTGPGRQVG